MGYIKENMEVNGIIPSEAISEALKGRDAAQALYNSLSIKVKPEDETPEQRKLRIMRRELVAKTFGFSVSDLEKYLGKHLKFQEQGITKEEQAPSDVDILKDKTDDVSAQDKKSVKSVISGVAGIGSAGTGIASGLGLTGASIATIAGIGLVPAISIVCAGVSIVLALTGGSKDLHANHKTKNEKNKELAEYLEVFMEKVGILNQLIEKKMDEIILNKAKMKPKQFTAYKKSLIEELRKEMKQQGVEIKVDKIEAESENKQKTTTEQPPAEPGE